MPASKPPKRPTIPPGLPRRRTQEVQMAWVEEDDTKVVLPKNPPPRRNTMEVDMSWLQSDTQPEPEKPAPRKKPPRLPGAKMTFPAMPVVIPPEAVVPGPPRRVTIEVEMDWLEFVEEKKVEEAKAKTERPPPRAPTARPPKLPTARPPKLPTERPPPPARAYRPLPVEESTKPKKIVKRPIRREED